jgi:hypothetical protein
MIPGRCARALLLLVLGAAGTGCGSTSPSDEDTSPFAPVTTAPGDSSSDGGTSTTASADPSTTTGLDDATTLAVDGTTVTPPLFDIGTQPDFAPPQCLQCSLSIASQQSGVFDVTGANVFATAVLLDGMGAPQDVYALGTYGTGRFIATADSSLPFNEVSDCPLTTWLSGGVEAPALLYFGWTPSDGPINFSVPGMVGAGVHLPAQYIGNPAQLRADYDIVMYLEASNQFDGGDEPTDLEMQTLLDYMELHGGGAYVSSEFANPMWNAYLDQNDLDSVNRLLLPLGIESLQVSLAWGDVDGNIDFDCFPPPAG